MDEDELESIREQKRDQLLDEEDGGDETSEVAPSEPVRVESVE